MKICRLVFLIAIVAGSVPAFAQNPSAVINNSTPYIGGNSNGDCLYNANGTVSDKPCGTPNILYVTGGSSDDSVAINAALATARAGQASNRIQYTVWVAGPVTLTHAVNLTCFNDVASTDGCANPGNWAQIKLDLSGAYVSCATSGAPCFDGLGSRFVVVTGGTVFGACNGTEPSYGIQIGRTVNTLGANDWTLDNVRFQGCFTKAAYYNLGSEDTVVTHSWFQNGDTSGAYSCVWDGGNFYQVTSAFVTESITQYQNQSFNDNIVIGSSCVQQPSGTGGGGFVYGTRRLKFENTYFNSALGFCLNIFNDSGGGNQAVAQDFYGDLHCEGSGATLTNVFEFTARNASTTSTLPSFRFHDHAVEATTSIFKLGTNVSAVVFNNEDFDVPSVTGTPAVFDTPADYTVTNIGKDYFASAVTGWNPTNSICSGAGSGATCQIINGYYAGLGLINLGTASSGTSATGVINLNFPYNVGANLSCQFGFQNRSGTWTAGNTGIVTTFSALTNSFTWTNGGAANLSVSSHYGLAFQCGAS